MASGQDWQRRVRGEDDASPSARERPAAPPREEPHGVVVERPRQLRLRQRVTKGPGSRVAGVAMAFKRIESAQTRWRAINAPHRVALVCAGAFSGW
jgi:hypothetical protein